MYILIYIWCIILSLGLQNQAIFGILKKVKKQEDDFWIEDSKFLEIENNLEEEVDTLDEEDGNL